MESFENGDCTVSSGDGGWRLVVFAFCAAIAGRKVTITM